MYDQIIVYLTDFAGQAKNPAGPDPPLAGFDRKDLRLLGMTLLSWLKMQHRFRKQRPLPIDLEFSWCQDLKRLLDVWPELGALFELSGDKCDFRDGVSEQDRWRLREQADLAYRPTVKR
jgi:hypothetical protein